MNLLDLQKMPGAGAETLNHVIPLIPGIASVSDVRELKSGAYAIMTYNGAIQKWHKIEENFELTELAIDEVIWPEKELRSLIPDFDEPSEILDTDGSKTKVTSLITYMSENG